MKHNPGLDTDLQMALKGQMIDQLPIIRGGIQLVLLRYPGDTFLNECMSRVLFELDRLTAFVFQEEGQEIH